MIEIKISGDLRAPSSEELFEELKTLIAENDHVLIEPTYKPNGYIGRLKSKLVGIARRFRECI